MKNIHILPTDKPSRLSILNSGKLNFGAEIMSSSNSKPQHIYITSDEEIKEGDWFYSIRELIEKAVIEYPKGEHFGKVILTTDQDLIKDGVQAIDNEFLEWFVKNPSCEEVEFESSLDFCREGDYIKYKTIIPQEKPKQETVEEAAENYSLHERKSKWGEIVRDSFKEGAKWQAERMYSEEEVENILIEYVKTNPTKPYRVISWFQQFKKK